MEILTLTSKKLEDEEEEEEGGEEVVEDFEGELEALEKMQKPMSHWFCC